jgi:hypothetical protein
MAVQYQFCTMPGQHSSEGLAVSEALAPVHGSRYWRMVNQDYSQQTPVAGLL